MNATFQIARPKMKAEQSTMRALVFRGPNQIALEQVLIPRPGPGEAVIRVTLTTICGTDLHILKGEYPVKPGLVMLPASATTKLLRHCVLAARSVCEG